MSDRGWGLFSIYMYVVKTLKMFLGGSSSKIVQILTVLCQTWPPRDTVCFPFMKVERNI